MQIGRRIPTHTQSAEWIWSQTAEDTCRGGQKTVKSSAKRNRYGSRVICPLDLLKYCDHTQAENSLVFLVCTYVVKPFLLKKNSNLYPQECNRSPDLAKTNLERVRSVRMGGTRSTVLCFMRLQTPSKSTFWIVKFIFLGARRKTDLTVLWHSTQKIQVWNRIYLASLSPWVTSKTVMNINQLCNRSRKTSSRYHLLNS